MSGVSELAAAALRPKHHGRGRTHGLIGSDSVSSQSSILLVCSRIASSGLGSLVASGREGPPNGEELPRW